MNRKTLSLVLVTAALAATQTGLAPAAANIAAPGIDCARYYTVRRGESLTRVARRFGATVNNLTSWNNLAAAPPASAGQTLCVRVNPDGAGPVTTTVTVQKGESLSVLAKRYRTTVAKLRKLNRVRTVKPGQTLLIPVKRVKARAV
jgi:LysM repeat protein